MDIIPVLEPVSNNLNLGLIGKYDLSIDEIFDELSKNYSTCILDIFEDTLKKDSSRLKKLESDYFKLANEEKYLVFLKKYLKLITIHVILE